MAGSSLTRQSFRVHCDAAWTQTGVWLALRWSRATAAPPRPLRRCGPRTSAPPAGEAARGRPLGPPSLQEVKNTRGFSQNLVLEKKPLKYDREVFTLKTVVVEVNRWSHRNTFSPCNIITRARETGISDPLCLVAGGDGMFHMQKCRFIAKIFSFYLHPESRVSQEEILRDFYGDACKTPLCFMDIWEIWLPFSAKLKRQKSEIVSSRAVGYLEFSAWRDEGSWAPPTCSWCRRRPPAGCSGSTPLLWGQAVSVGLSRKWNFE